MMHTDDDDDDDWDEFFLMDLCMKLVLYFVGVIFSVLPRKVNIFFVFLSKFLAWDFYLFGPKEAACL